MNIDPGAIEKLARGLSSSFRAKRKTGTGEPEAALRGPFETFLTEFATEVGRELVLSDEAHLSHVEAKPDWSANVDGVLVGYVELKKPGTGADTSKFTGRNKKQWERLSRLPNLLYSDGNEWALYRYGQCVGEVQPLDGDIRTGDHVPVDPDAFASLVDGFLNWQPIAPRTVAELAATSARLCRLLRDEVGETLGSSSRLKRLAKEWRDLLFPEATDAAFADQYAQTVTFALLLARAEGITLDDQPFRDVAYDLSRRHGLLGKALEILTDDRLLKQLATSLEVLQRVIGAVDWQKLTGGPRRSVTASVASPWLHFYEDFLAEYDADLRRSTGSYYTPDEVVACTVRLVDEALTTYLARPLGLASDDVTVVDPAVGTGTYLIRVLDTVASAIAADRGEGFVAAELRDFANRMVGFEIQTGPFAVAQMRLAATFRRHKAALADEQLRLYVTDTLDNPYVEQASLGSFYEPIARSRRQANRVKADERVLVVLGNPPYRNKAKGRGGWVELGDANVESPPLLDDFQPPPGHEPGGNQTQELRNLYVYFWRWALWKAFEAHPGSTTGVVAFITSSAWLMADGLVGMRHHVRGICDRLHVIDLGGQGRGGRKEDNVFAIQTPVAIVIAVRDGSRTGRDADVHYRRIHGSRAEKLAQLDPPIESGKPVHPVISLADDSWVSVAGSRTDPIGAGAAESWTGLPALTDLFPWTAPGLKPNRTWVYAPQADLLRERWQRLIDEPEPAVKERLFKPSYHARFHGDYPSLPGHPHTGTIAEESGDCPDPEPVGFRSFDRQWIIPDRRLIHSPSPPLWRAHSSRQVYIGFNPTPGDGPATTFSAHLPDMAFFQGNANAGGSVIPLWRDEACEVPNISPGLLSFLSQHLGVAVTAEDLLAYVAGVTAHPAYTRRYWDELETPGVRVPLTSDSGLFRRAVEAGREVVWAHTYGLRFDDASAGRPLGHVRMPGEGPKVLQDIPPTPERMPNELKYDADEQILHVGEGTIGPVAPAVMAYEVSDMDVVRKWFSYRKAAPAGRTSSDLDKIVATSWTPQHTKDLLDLLHVLGRVQALEAQQDELLDRIVSGPTIGVADLSRSQILPVPESSTKAPTEDRDTPTLFS